MEKFTFQNVTVTHLPPKVVDKHHNNNQTILKIEFLIYTNHLHVCTSTDRTHVLHST
jgi:hypothetical protein